MIEHASKRAGPALGLVLIMVLGACLLSLGLGGNALFEDEVMGLRIADGPTSMVIRQAIRDVHPPLHFILLNSWTAFAGVSAVSARALSVLFALLTIWVTYRLAVSVFPGEGALLSALLVAVSPYIIFYSRLGRYYSLVTFLYLLSVLLLVRAVRRGNLGWWLAYAASAAALLYTNYIGLFALPGALLYAAWKGRRAFLHCVAALACVFLAFLPLLPWMLAQAQRFGPGEGHGGVARCVMDVAAKVAFACYALALGETVLFWNLIVVIPALVIAAALFIYGIIRTIGGRKEGWIVLLLFYLVPFAGIVIFSSVPSLGVFSARSPALFPARVVMLAPFFYMVVANGLYCLLPARRIAACAALLCVFIYSLVNLYSGRGYLNEKYVSPWREIAAFVGARAGAADFVASRENAFWFYYLGGDTGRMRSEAGKTAGSGVKKVWIIERMRGDTTLTLMPRLGPSFPSSYRLIDVHPFQPIDESKRRMYSRLRGKDVGSHYIEVRVYERVDDRKGEGLTR